MDWDSIMNFFGDAMEKNVNHLEGNLKSKARGYSDSQLLSMYNKDDLAPMAREIVENEMRRRGIL